MLGGLIQDTLLESVQSVPILGKIPLLGNLFRSRKTEKKKTNLMIFIRAEIMRDSIETAFQTNANYNMILDVQKDRESDAIQLMPGTPRPMIPPLPESQPQPTESQNDASE